MHSHDEAINIFNEIIQSFFSPTHNLISILRKCQHACEILGWQNQKNWFHQELNGYFPDTPLPPYRIINGTIMWSFEGSLPDGVMYRMEVDKYGLNPEIYPEINDILEVKAGINWIISAATTGYTEKLSDIKNVTSPSGRGNVKLRKIRSFPSANFSYSISQIERITYDFVSSSYVQLQYGNRVKDIWDRYRTTVETALQQLGFANHLSIIQDNIGKDNPEAWRAAVFECRSMLNDLADYLWKDPRDTYDLLKGSGSNGKLEVKQNNFGNRLSAYLHQKSVNGDEGKFLRDEAGKLSDSIENLIKLQNKGHKSIERPLADMVVLSTYFIIGEIAIRTDLMPIMEYSATQQI